MTAFNRKGLNVNVDCSRKDETRFDETTEDGNFPAIRSNLYLQTHTHHNLGGTDSTFGFMFSCQLHDC